MYGAGGSYEAVACTGVCVLTGTSDRPNLTLPWLAHTSTKSEVTPDKISSSSAIIFTSVEYVDAFFLGSKVH